MMFIAGKNPIYIGQLEDFKKHIQKKSVGNFEILKSDWSTEVT